MKKQILITGATGQLGNELIKSAPKDISLLCPDSTELNVSSVNSVDAFFSQHSPDYIINCAAYTAVDKAEAEKEKAFLINEQGASNLALATKNVNGHLIQISTDFVFDGAQGTPYCPTDKTNPLNTYGASKLGGEIAVSKYLENHSTIFRTSWLYSSHGNNFVKTIIRLIENKEEVSIIADQIGTPTWAGGLAQTIWQSIDLSFSGLQHWSDAGVASWYDFAVAIQEEAKAIGLIKKNIPIHPITTEQYPTPAQRPRYSVMDKQTTWQQLGMHAPHWRVNLRKMLKELKEQ